MARWSGTWQRIETADLKRLEAKSAAFDKLRQAISDVFRDDWSGGLHVLAVDGLNSLLIDLNKAFGVVSHPKKKGCATCEAGQSRNGS